MEYDQDGSGGDTYVETNRGDLTLGMNTTYKSTRKGNALGSYNQFGVNG